MTILKNSALLTEQNKDQGVTVILVFKSKVVKCMKAIFLPILICVVQLGFSQSKKEYLSKNRYDLHLN
jgi:hypothetical protein